MQQDALYNRKPLHHLQIPFCVQKGIAVLLQCEDGIAYPHGTCQIAGPLLQVEAHQVFVGFACNFQVRMPLLLD